MEDLFLKRYQSLNTGQKKAVDTIDGPVMVIAGPGTGKTQVLALRIGKILKETDTSADGILCLTFTNAGVEAMRKRLYEYIGETAGRVAVLTFHAFGTRLIEEFYSFLDLPRAPKMLDDDDTLSLVDYILNTHEWKHIRPRNNAALYFRDLRSLVSLLIRESLSPEDLQKEIDADIARITNDPANISSRGARKGELKMEALSRIDSLEKTCEVVTFYTLYMAEKRARNVMDYDDILSSMVRLASESDEVRDTLRERYLYVLVDEHQDSSGVQNEFLKQVWSDVERPNIFVVGDDRQLIYGFSGASLSHFEEFKETFPGTKVVTLTDNYRSTKTILNAAETLLSSRLASGKLESNRTDDHPIELVECAYPRDEILSAGLFFKEQIASGIAPEECALLVPKNAQARAAATILRDMGLPVSAPGSLKLFGTPEFQSFLHIARIVADPFAGVDLAESLLDPLSGVPALAAHDFLHRTDSRQLSVQSLLAEGEASGLLAGVNPLYQWGKLLEGAIERSKHLSLYELIQDIGKHFFLDQAPDHEAFVLRVEIIRSLLHLALTLEEKDRHADIRSFINFLNRLVEYGEDVPLAVFGADKGIRIMTLHGSKGLEFDAVWIAHMTERSLMGSKQLGFTLPERVRERVSEKDEAAATREVYVAITRAKRFCVLSYSSLSHRGGDERLAGILEALPKTLFVTKSGASSEEKLLSSGAENFVTSARAERTEVTKKELQTLVSEHYTKKRISVTLLNNFYECPWKWYFRSFLEVPEQLSESLEFGSVVHSAIERIVTLDHVPSIEEIDQALKEALDECHITDPLRTSRMQREATVAIKRFAEVVLPGLYPKRESEKSIAHKDERFPSLTIYGKLDLVEYQGNTARVTDFKTGKTRKASEIEKRDDEGRVSTYLRQLAMYSYLLTHRREHTQVDSSRLYFIEDKDPTKACFETRIEPEHIELLMKDIKDYQHVMESGEWTERECNYKPHQGEPDCPYCEKAKMYK